MAAGRADRSFPKACRLVSSDDFRRVYRNARRGRVGPFAWHACPNNQGQARLGLAVPKRVLKRATDRARVKRLIRESFRHHRSELPAVDVVVTLKTQPRDVHDPALHAQIARIWEAVSTHMGGAS
ncbi:MAG TPA: ribonuclease P protein component [Arenicellales bacterium]|nr:ribonuclease P protein component [Arenicellales bacterium]